MDIVVPEEVKAEEDTLLWEIETLTITETTLSKGKALLRAAASLKKTIKGLCAEPISKAYEAHKAMKALEKTLLQPTLDAELIIRQKLAQYAEEIEKQRRKVEARIEEERRQAAPANAPAPPPIKVNTPLDDGGFRAKWVWEITDEQAVPEEYWTIDAIAIERVVRVEKDKTNIPGIKVIKKMIPVAR